MDSLSPHLSRRDGTFTHRSVGKRRTDSPVRYIFLLVGFALVLLVLGDHGPGFYIGTAIVYGIFRSMDPSNNRRSSSTVLPTLLPKVRTPESSVIASSSPAEITTQADQPMTRWPAAGLTPESTADTARTQTALTAIETVAESREAKQTPQSSASQDLHDDVHEIESATDDENAAVLEKEQVDHLVMARSFASLAEAHLAEGLLKSIGIESVLGAECKVGPGPVSLMVGSRDLVEAHDALNFGSPDGQPAIEFPPREIESTDSVRLRKEDSSEAISRPRSRKKRAWIGIASSLLVLVLLFGKPAYKLLKPDDPVDHLVEYPSPTTDHEYRATMPIFDFGGCVAAQTAEFRHATQSVSPDSQSPLTPHRIASIKWFCSREWDQSRLSRDAALLDAKGLSFCKVLAAVDPSNPRKSDCDLAAIPDEFRAFSIVFDSVPVIELMEEQIHPLPVRRTGAEARMFGSVIKRTKSELQERVARYVTHKRLPVNYDEDLAQVHQTARDYRFSRPPLNLRIITTIGLRTSLRDLYHSAYLFSAITSETRHGESPVLSAIEPEKQIDTNFSMELICVAASILVRGSIQLLGSLREVDYRDPETLGRLTMILVGPLGTDTELPNPIAERDGWYDPDTLTLGVKSVAGLEFSRKPSMAIWQKEMEELLPATLSHEIYHHLFYRPSIASSGFELEGEATAYGEYAHQMQVEGARVSMDDPIAVLNRKIAKQGKEHPGEMTDELREDFLKLVRLEEERSKQVKLTPVQCNCLRIIASTVGHSQNGIDLGDDLTLTSGDLQSRADVSTLYAFAWAIYERSRRDNLDTDASTIELIHSKLHQHLGISNEDRRTLAAIVDATVNWAGKELKRRNECR
jgi:hypothetical protein